MGLLDQLWDDTVAGPRPENGLGKLRKHPSLLSPRSISGKESECGIARSYNDGPPGEEVKVTRSIMIGKPPGLQFGSPPVSPAGSTPPLFPFSGSPSGFEGGQRRIHTRRQPKVDPGALLVLTTCEI